MRTLLCGFFVLAFVCQETDAQQEVDSLKAFNLAPGAPSLFQWNVIPRLQQATIRVGIWGRVKNPGAYEVERTANLAEVISYAGGPLIDAKMKKVRISRIAPENWPLTDGRIDLELNLDNLRLANNQNMALQNGDIIRVDRRGSFWSRNWTKFALAGTVVASVIYIAKTFALVRVKVNYTRNN